MKTRRSTRNQNILWRSLGGPRDVVNQVRPAHLDMTDAEIEKRYWHFPKASLNQLKREAAQERLKTHGGQIVGKEKTT